MCMAAMPSAVYIQSAESEHLLVCRHLLSVNLQLHAYIYRLDSIGALHIHVMHSLLTYCFYSRWQCSCCYCHSHCVLQRSLLQVFFPVHVPFPFSSYTFISKNEDIFIGGGHVMSHSQLAYVLEFSHARIQLVQTLISTFLS